MKLLYVKDLLCNPSEEKATPRWTVTPNWLHNTFVATHIATAPKGPVKPGCRPNFYERNTCLCSCSCSCSRARGSQTGPRVHDEAAARNSSSDHSAPAPHEIGHHLQVTKLDGRHRRVLLYTCDFRRSGKRVLFWGLRKKVPRSGEAGRRGR